jgi:thiamine biosynthesis lipoprotein
MWLRPIILAVLFLLAGCGRESLHSQESFVFGTRVEVLVWDKNETRARKATAEVLREFDRLHRTYHAWQPSELTGLNAAIAASRPHEVSAELAALIVEAQALAAQCEFLFDPGIGALVQLWGFHDDTFKPQLPDAGKLVALKQAKPSIAALKVQGRQVTSSNPSVALDFGGYLKGVALDRAAAIIKAHGLANALINIGGNVMALGAKGSQPWRVGIQHPRAAQAGGAPLATLELRDGEAIGTSGDYQRYFELDGRRYSHLLDPRTGAPAGSGGGPTEGGGVAAASGMPTPGDPAASAASASTVAPAPVGSGTAPRYGVAPVVGSQALTVLIAPREQAGLWSDVASKPLFVAGDDWRRLATKLGITQVLRVDAAGRIEVTEALRPRLKFEGEKSL